PHTSLPFDVHLMVTPVDPLIESVASAGADIIIIHPDSGFHTHRSLLTIKNLGKKAGLALNPGTPIEVVDPVFDLLDVIMVMTVNPGFSGQPFLESQLRKISTLREKIQDSGRLIDISVDGG